MRPALLGLGTAVPEHALPQAQIATWLARALERQPGAPDGFGRVVHRMAERAGVQNRATVLPDYTTNAPERFSFYPPTWDLAPFPTTATRMMAYREHAVPLAARAARQAPTYCDST